MEDFERRFAEFKEEIREEVREEMRGLEQRLDDRMDTMALAQKIAGEQVRDLHELFLRRSKTGRPPMAEQMQELLTVYTSAKFGARAVLWGFGFIAAAGAAWAAVRGWWPGDK